MTDLSSSPLILIGAARTALRGAVLGAAATRYAQEMNVSISGSDTFPLVDSSFHSIKVDNRDGSWPRPLKKTLKNCVVLRIFWEINKNL